MEELRNKRLLNPQPKSTESTQVLFLQRVTTDLLGRLCEFPYVFHFVGSAVGHNGEMDSPKSVLYENPGGATSFSRFPSFMDSCEDSQMFFSRTRSFSEVPDTQDLFFGPL